MITLIASVLQDASAFLPPRQEQRYIPEIQEEVAKHWRGQDVFHILVRYPAARRAWRIAVSGRAEHRERPMEEGGQRVQRGQTTAARGAATGSAEPGAAALIN